MEEIFKSLSESVSEECYNDIMGIVEEILMESKYSAADVVKAARNSLPKRENELSKAEKNGDFWEVLRLKHRSEHAKALASLPNPKKSGVSANKLDRAAFNSAVKRGDDSDETQERINRSADMVRPYNGRDFNARLISGAKYDDESALPKVMKGAKEYFS